MNEPKNIKSIDFDVDKAIEELKCIQVDFTDGAKVNFFETLERILKLPSFLSGALIIAIPVSSQLVSSPRINIFMI